MNIVAFKMKLKAGVHEEYLLRHDQIWPELIDHLRDMGLSEYRIFLDQEDLQSLFAIQCRSNNFDDEKLRNHPIMKKWWDYMADLMYVSEDNSPLTFHMQQVFYMP